MITDDNFNQSKLRENEAKKNGDAISFEDFKKNKENEINSQDSDTQYKRIEYAKMKVKNELDPSKTISAISSKVLEYRKAALGYPLNDEEAA